jgi:hypothetical protein
VRLNNGQPALLVVDLAKRLTAEERFATLVHELAHIYCGHLNVSIGVWWPHRPLDRPCREFEAEAVAWIVCSRKGLDPGSYRYLEGYLRPNARIPEVSLNQIMVAANHIEQLASGRALTKTTERKTPLIERPVQGILSLNPGEPYTPGGEQVELPLNEQ